MTRPTAVLLSLVLFAIVLAGLAVWAARRNHTASDFLLSSHRLGPWLTGAGFALNAFNATLLMLFAAAAFRWGLSAAWIWAAVMLGYVLNMFYVAPRLRLLSLSLGAQTLMQFLTADAGDRGQRLVLRSASFMLLSLLLAQTAAQLHLIGSTLGMQLDVGLGVVITMTTLWLAGCLLFGGYWSASANDVLQGILMLMFLLLLPLPAIIAAGGWQELRIGLAALGPPATDVFYGKGGVVAVAFCVGWLGIGLSSVGQPQAAQRLIAARDDEVLRKARWIGLPWIAIMTAAALLCGWCAKVMFTGLSQPEHALFALADRLLPAAVGGFITVGLLTAVLCSVGSQFIVAAGNLAADLRRPTSTLTLHSLQIALVLFALVAACAARFVTPSLLQFSLFAFTALGAAFGPLLMVRVSGKRVRPGSMMGAMWAGFLLTVLFHLLPDAPGDFMERVFPFVASLGIALSGGERRRNPDRADRGQQTVHDRVPI